MKFYIVTPCYRALPRLQGCVRSVADQAGRGIEVHHHVQDAASDDGTDAWLQEWQDAHAGVPGYTFTFETAPDGGMYDALNKAWALLPTDADVTAHLNADEQYLPDALKAVAEQFLQHSAADIVETAYLVTDRDGNYHCHRRPVQPQLWRSMRACELMTCATFHRADPFRRHGIRFDTRYRVYGDVLFCRRLLQAGLRVVTAPRCITSAFAMTGLNLGWQESSRAEGDLLNAETPRLSLLLLPLATRCSNLCRRLVDFCCPPPQQCALYHGSETTRRTERITNPTTRWHSPAIDW